MISLTLWKILLISLPMTPLSAVTSHLSDRQAAASSFYSDLDKNHKLVKHNFAYVSILSTLCVLPYPSSLPASIVCLSLTTFSKCLAVVVSPCSCCSLYVVSYFFLCNSSSMSLDHAKNKNQCPDIRSIFQERIPRE